ncbi:aldolase [Paenibacillus agaridevorans]|uniref:Aldolase n=1 Tax=Paenibacillus agaridevorans TaxID=171404 RepID=A0A2R5ET87_9BACL|nr:aldolase [Paenibacillus agaridevorans]GBG08889.1 aldolase [Paenibacillus agaridevorans]
MNIPEKTARYRSFGLIIESEFRLPELRLIDSADSGMNGNMPDVVITRQPLEKLWQELTKVNEFLAVGENSVLIRVPDTAIFGIKDGRTIEVSSSPTADEDKIRLYLLGSCMGILLMQKRILPLHGSAVAIDGQAYAIVGASGAGKSTLSSYLMEQGHELLSDDLIAVHIGEGGNPIVMPAYPQQKIWQESMQLLGKSTAGLKPIYKRETKFAVPVEGAFLDTPLPLAGVFELTKHDKNAEIVSIAGLERFHAMLRHTFRGFLLEPLGLMEWHFRTLSRFAGRIDMFRLSRPFDGDSLACLYRLMIQSTKKEMLL